MTKLYFDEYFNKKYRYNPVLSIFSYNVKIFYFLNLLTLILNSKTIEMFERMKALFLERIQKINWMDEESREKTIAKVILNQIFYFSLSSKFEIKFIN